MNGIFFLGPYGNLTTLYANILALHPDVIGLNHARDRVPSSAAFWDGKDPLAKLENFAEFVRKNQDESHVGPDGGSFKQAHASRKGVVKDLEQLKSSTYSSSDASHFVWKESGYLTSQFRIGRTIDAFTKLMPDAQFIRPIRNPIHWLRTNLESWHWNLYDDTWGKPMTYENACSPGVFANWYLRDLSWFLRLREMYGSRFIVHFENDSFTNITDHLNLSCDKKWLQTACETAEGVRHRESPKDLAVAFEQHLMYYKGDEYDKIMEDFIKPALV